MKSSALVILFALFFSCAIAGAELIKSSTANSSIETGALSAQSAFEKSEAAYRANNIGVALLEQYKAKGAADSFTRALEIKPDLVIARINLSIALYYLPDAGGAKRESRARADDVQRQLRVCCV